MVPTASSWPAWPTYRTVNPLRLRTLSSWCTLVTSGQTASTTAPPRARAASTTSGAEPWALSISGAPGGHVGHVVDEDDALGTEALDHVPVVDDLVVAVHRRLEDPHHPGQGLDRLLDAGAEPPWLGQHDSVDSGHKVQVIGSNL